MTDSSIYIDREIEIKRKRERERQKLGGLRINFLKFYSLKYRGNKTQLLSFACCARPKRKMTR